MHHSLRSFARFYRDTARKLAERLKALNAAGVNTAAEPRDLPALRYAFIQDPNGIRVEIVKRILTP